MLRDLQLLGPAQTAAENLINRYVRPGAKRNAAAEGRTDIGAALFIYR
jgi:hypothetical protein